MQAQQVVGGEQLMGRNAGDEARRELAMLMLSVFLANGPTGPGIRCRQLSTKYKTKGERAHGRAQLRSPQLTNADAATNHDAAH
jgi:hypothetical protein